MKNEKKIKLKKRERLELQHADVIKELSAEIKELRPLADEMIARFRKETEEILSAAEAALAAPEGAGLILPRKAAKLLKLMNTLKAKPLKTTGRYVKKINKITKKINRKSALAESRK